MHVCVYVCIYVHVDIYTYIHKGGRWGACIIYKPSSRKLYTRDFVQGYYVHMCIHTHMGAFFQLIAGLDEGKGARIEDLLRSKALQTLQQRVRAACSAFLMRACAGHCYVPELC